MVQYYVVLVVVTLMTVLCINLTRGNLGRTWKATRDMDIAAELIGINLMKSKLTAFAVSSYIVGVAGALFVFMWRGAAEPNLFDIPLSFRILFIAIIGGLGSIMGNYLGAILIVGLPVVLNTLPRGVRAFRYQSAMVEHLNIMIVGALIVFFLIIEPHGLAQLLAADPRETHSSGRSRTDGGAAAMTNRTSHKFQWEETHETLYQTGGCGASVAAVMGTAAMAQELYRAEPVLPDRAVRGDGHSADERAARLHGDAERARRRHWRRAGRTSRNARPAIPPKRAWNAMKRPRGRRS